MTYAEFEWLSSDGIRMFGCEWKPAEGRPVKAVIGIVHGMGEHTGRYRHMANMFTSEGYAVLSFDQRGHGRSGGRRGDCPNYEALLEGVDFLLAEMKRRHPRTPAFLYAHSMGGNVTLNYLLRRKPKLCGAVVAGPWLKLAASRPPMAILARRIVERLAPGTTKLRYLIAERSTSDPDMIRRNAEDPYRHGKVTARFFYLVQKAGLWALAHARELSVPLLLLHGGDDRITSINASRLFAERALHKCAFYEWPGFRHELHNETGRQEVFGVVLHWLNGQLGDGGKQANDRRHE